MCTIFRCICCHMSNHKPGFNIKPPSRLFVQLAGYMIVSAAEFDWFTAPLILCHCNRFCSLSTLSIHSPTLESVWSIITLHCCNVTRFLCARLCRRCMYRNVTRMAMNRIRLFEWMKCLFTSIQLHFFPLILFYMYIPNLNSSLLKLSQGQFLVFCQISNPIR